MFSGLRWKILIALLLIAGLSFCVMAGSLSSMVGDYLFEKRISSEKTVLEALADEIAPMMESGERGRIVERLLKADETLGGQVLLLDGESRVLIDSRETNTGFKIDLPEVNGVLKRGEKSAWGLHSVQSGRQVEVSRLLSLTTGSDGYVAYCAAGIVVQSRVLGVLVMMPPVRELTDGLQELRLKELYLFLAVAAAVLVCSLVLSRLLMRPIQHVMRGIQRMSMGDFSTRVSVKSSGEMKQLAEAFNTMSQKLEALDQSRNQFVSNASHELKTPLATMKILLESLIYQPEMDKKLRTEFLNDINSEIDRLSNVVSDLLTLVQMDAQNVHLNRENLSIAALIKENAHRLQPLVDNKEQKLQLTLSDPCDTYADKSKLNLVFYNLMENAVKYTQNKGIIKVTLQRQGHNALLTVTDDGPGIPQENLPHIFDRFYRVDKARSREKGGTGLGLSIVHQLVLLHDGTICVDSKEGSGTTFTVELPLH